MCERAARVECVFERAKQLNIAAAATRPFALPLSPPRPGPRFPHRTRPSGSPGRNRRRQRRRRRRPPPLSTNETPPLAGDGGRGGRRTGCRGCARARSGEGEMKTELHQEEWGQLTSHAGGTGRRTEPGLSTAAKGLSEPRRARSAGRAARRAVGEMKS